MKTGNTVNAGIGQYTLGTPAANNPSHPKTTNDKLEAITSRREFMAAAIISSLRVGWKELSIHAPH
jgi:hypothetical protein